MDNRFLQWLAGGLGATVTFAVVVGNLRGQNINGVAITSLTALIGIIVGAVIAKKDPPKDGPK